MFCSKCGAQLVKDAVYCTECGNKVGADMSVQSNEAYDCDTEVDNFTHTVKSVSTDDSKGEPLAYIIALFAFALVAIAFFLPFMTIKAWGYDSMQVNLYEAYIAGATGADVLVPIGLGIVYVLIFFKERTLRIIAGIIAILCIGHPLYEYIETSEKMSAQLEIGGILYLIAGIALIVACFIPIKANTEEK